MFTKQNCNVFIMAALLCAAIAYGQDFFSHDSELNLLTFMTRSNSLVQRNPLRSVDCFNYYIPLINENAANYQKNFKECGDRANLNRIEIDDASLSSRMEFRNRTSNSCELMTICEEDPTALGELGCYANQGPNTAKLNQVIGSDATGEMNQLTELHLMNDRKEMRCTNDTKSAYEKESAQNYADFNGCLMGDPLPTTSTTPEITTTTPEISTISTTAQISTTDSYWDTTSKQSS